MRILCHVKTKIPLERRRALDVDSRSLPKHQVAMQDIAVRPDTASPPFPDSVLRGPMPGFKAPFLVQADERTAGMPRGDLLARLTDGPMARPAPATANLRNKKNLLKAS